MTPQPNAHGSSSDSTSHRGWDEYFTRAPIRQGRRDDRATRGPSSPPSPATPASAVPQADGSP